MHGAPVAQSDAFIEQCRIDRARRTIDKALAIEFGTHRRLLVRRQRTRMRSARPPETRRWWRPLGAVIGTARHAERTTGGPHTQHGCEFVDTLHQDASADGGVGSSSK